MHTYYPPHASIEVPKNTHISVYVGEEPTHLNIKVNKSFVVENGKINNSDWIILNNTDGVWSFRSKKLLEAGQISVLAWTEAKTSPWHTFFTKTPARLALRKPPSKPGVGRWKSLKPVLDTFEYDDFVLFVRDGDVCWCLKELYHSIESYSKKVDECWNVIEIAGDHWRFFRGDFVRWSSSVIYEMRNFMSVIGDQGCYTVWHKEDVGCFQFYNLSLYADALLINKNKVLRSWPKIDYTQMKWK